MEAHKIVKSVQNAFPGLPERIARFAGKTEELWASHGREPKTRNPASSGNVSPVTHILEYAHKYEAASPGAGRMLISRIKEDFDAEYAAADESQSQIHSNILTETYDVQKWLTERALEQETPSQLISFEQECNEAIESLQAGIAKARAIRRQKESGIEPKLSAVKGGRR